ncbi:MAG: DUF6614 family protein, partial [Pseudomonadota bacterium]
LLLFFGSRVLVALYRTSIWFCYGFLVLYLVVLVLAQLDAAFRLGGSHDEDVAALHRAVHDLIAAADFALYRPFPDPERSERMALI